MTHTAGGIASGRSRIIVSADDFGLSVAVNEGIECAHREGMLSTASLMVAGPAAADAVVRAKRNPALNVGLHLVAIEGPAVLPPAAIPHLVNGSGTFSSDQFGLGVRYRFARNAARELAREIEAQFEAFAATGLRLDHANAHKHMHLHPVVGRLLVETGRAFGLRAVRVPTEPAAPLAACGTPPTLGAAALRAWTRLLRARVRRAGMVTTDHCFGIAWSGAITAGRLLCLLDHLPAGVSEIYFHPASGRDPVLDRLMPGYDHEGELAVLTDESLVAQVKPVATGWSALRKVGALPQTPPGAGPLDPLS